MLREDEQQVIGESETDRNWIDREDEGRRQHEKRRLR